MQDHCDAVEELRLTPWHDQPFQLPAVLSEWGMVAAMGLALALYYFSDSIWVAVLGGLALAVLAWRRLDLALLVTVFVIPFYRFPRHFGNLSFSLSEFTVLLTFAVWLLQRGYRWARRETGLAEIVQPLIHPWSATLFLFAATISLFFTDHEYLKFSLREYRTVVLEPWFFFVMLISVLKGSRDAGRLIGALVLLGGVVAAVSLYQYFVVGMVEATEGVRRMLSPVYHSPNALALFLGRAFPIALVLALFLGRDSGARYLRLLFAVCAALMGAGIFFTYSRGAWIAVMVSVLFVAAIKGRRFFASAVVAIGALAVAAFSFVNLGRLVSAMTTELRVSLWQSALHMIRDRPIFGVGLDNFLYYYRDRGYMLPDAWREPDMSHPHNLILDYWTRIGILGLASLVALQVTFWRGALISYRRLGAGRGQVLVLALMASMVDFLVHGLIDNSYFLIDLAMVFWLTLAAMELIKREET